MLLGGGLDLRAYLQIEVTKEKLEVSLNDTSFQIDETYWLPPQGEVFAVTITVDASQIEAFVLNESAFTEDVAEAAGLDASNVTYELVTTAPTTSPSSSPTSTPSAAPSDAPTSAPHAPAHSTRQRLHFDHVSEAELEQLNE